MSRLAFFGSTNGAEVSHEELRRRHESFGPRRGRPAPLHPVFAGILAAHGMPQRDEGRS